MKLRHGNEPVEWLFGDLTADFEKFLDGDIDVVLDKGCLDAMLVKPVERRANETDTWLIDPADPAVSSAICYLRNCATAISKSAQGGRMLIVTRAQRQNREPILRAAGLEVLSWEDLEVSQGVARLGVVRGGNMAR
eukprot:SAG31_NODE_926_length_10930_cov_135.691626_11_plen_136_part_00